MECTTTGRGFALIKFTDRNALPCTLQKSSIATEDAIWLGVDDPQPQILARDAAAHGVATRETTGWVPYPIPEEVLLSTRMHLTVAQVAELIPVLQRFVRTGDISGEADDQQAGSTISDLEARLVTGIDILQEAIQDEDSLLVNDMVMFAELLQDCLDAMNAPHPVPADDCKACEELCEQRDNWEERATALADAVGEYFDVPVGEHSSANCPINEAMKILNGEYVTKFDAVETPEPDPLPQDAPRLLDKDEARVAIWNAIRNIRTGNRDDDKLILNELNQMGFGICALLPQGGE